MGGPNRTVSGEEGSHMFYSAKVCVSGHIWTGDGRTLAARTCKLMRT